MKRDEHGYPYKPLGLKLKRLRIQRQETVAEVSGAVEIDVDMLQDIETGARRPSEDILMLLISHFAPKEDEATTLWELAGYDPERNNDMNDDTTVRQTVMVMPMDVRIVYTDMVHVVVNDFGVVMNFMQGAGPSNQPLAIARVGMSREHAQSVLEVLQKTLADSEPKPLPEPKRTKKQTDDADKPA